MVSLSCFAAEAPSSPKVETLVARLNQREGDLIQEKIKVTNLVNLLKQVPKMVAFGKKLKECQIEEWQGYYLSYKNMKKKVNRYARQLEHGEQTHQSVLKEFSKMLDIDESYLYD